MYQEYVHVLDAEARDSPSKRTDRITAERHAIDKTVVHSLNHLDLFKKSHGIRAGDRA